MRLSSSNFSDGQAIPVEFTCQGEGSAPDLAIESVPDSAKSLALTMIDPDSPSGNFVHWLAWNIPADTSAINDGQLPSGSLQGYNDFSQLGYGGPCPAQGLHHYHFKLYALDISLELAEGAYLKDLENAIYNHIVTQSELIGTYQKY